MILESVPVDSQRIGKCLKIPTSTVYVVNKLSKLSTEHKFKKKTINTSTQDASSVREGEKRKKGSFI